jgi:hypothetical protein
MKQAERRAGSKLSLILDPEFVGWRRYVSPKRRLTFPRHTVLHLRIVATVKNLTSNLVQLARMESVNSQVRTKDMGEDPNLEGISPENEPVSPRTNYGQVVW